MIVDSAKAKWLAFTGVFVAIGGAAIVSACSTTSDNQVVGPVAAVDAGTDVTITPKEGENKYCPAIGTGDNQVSLGSPICNQCASNKCCKELYDCTGTGPDGGVSVSVSEYSDCAYRYICELDNCRDVPDSGGCLAECDTKFGAEANAKARLLSVCLYGVDKSHPQLGEGCARVDGGVGTGGDCH